jgi:hypothetical protein
MKGRHSIVKPGRFGEDKADLHPRHYSMHPDPPRFA